MKKLYLSAPLPFQGQKYRFARKFIQALELFQDCTVFVDLFGGSGLLSHITKHQRPDATVVYNDFDNYRRRLENIPNTNALLTDLRAIAKDLPRNKAITGAARERILERIVREEEQTGYVDYITLSSSLLFSMNYAQNLEELKKQRFYNAIRITDYPPCPGYLEGLEITGCDYKELYEQYKDVPGVVFLVDPPYLSTEAGAYKLYWRLPEYLDVPGILRGHSFVYFTSNKSSIVELCEWLSRNRLQDNPFEGCMRVECAAHMQQKSKYTDIMLYKKAASPPGDAAPFK